MKPIIQIFPRIHERCLILRISGFKSSRITLIEREDDILYRSISQDSLIIRKLKFIARGGSRTVATSKMERFAIIVNGFQPLTIITKRSILDVAAALDPPLVTTL